MGIGQVLPELPLWLPTDPAVPAEATRAALREARVTVDFAEANLSDVVAQLAVRATVTMGVDWRSVERAGMTKEAPVTAHLGEVTLERALEVILGDCGGGV